MTQSALPLSQLPGVAAEGSTLVTEFMPMLRRALGQQAPVKQALYRGLAALVSADAESATVLLPLLYPHLQHYVTASVRGSCQLRL
jgi:FANCI helical domain 2